MMLLAKYKTYCESHIKVHCHILLILVRYYVLFLIACPVLFFIADITILGEKLPWDFEEFLFDFRNQAIRNMVVFFFMPIVHGAAIILLISKLTDASYSRLRLHIWTWAVSASICVSIAMSSIYNSPGAINYTFNRYINTQVLPISALKSQLEVTFSGQRCFVEESFLNEQRFLFRCYEFENKQFAFVTSGKVERDGDKVVLSENRRVGMNLQNGWAVSSPMAKRQINLKRRLVTPKQARYWNAGVKSHMVSSQFPLSKSGLVSISDQEEWFTNALAIGLILSPMYILVIFVLFSFFDFPFIFSKIGFVISTLVVPYLTIAFYQELGNWITPVVWFLAPITAGILIGEIVPFTLKVVSRLHRLYPNLVSHSMPGSVLSISFLLSIFLFVFGLFFRVWLQLNFQGGATEILWSELIIMSAYIALFLFPVVAVFAYVFTIVWFRATFYFRRSEHQIRSVFLKTHLSLLCATIVAFIINENHILILTERADRAHTEVFWGNSSASGGPVAKYTNDHSLLLFQKFKEGAGSPFILHSLSKSELVYGLAEQSEKGILSKNGFRFGTLSKQRTSVKDLFIPNDYFYPTQYFYISAIRLLNLYINSYGRPFSEINNDNMARILKIKYRFLVLLIVCLSVMLLINRLKHFRDWLIGVEI